MPFLVFCWFFGAAACCATSRLKGPKGQYWNWLVINALIEILSLLWSIYEDMRAVAGISRLARIPRFAGGIFLFASKWESEVGRDNYHTCSLSLIDCNKKPNKTVHHRIRIYIKFISTRWEIQHRWQQNKHFASSGKLCMRIITSLVLTSFCKPASCTPSAVTTAPLHQATLINMFHKKFGGVAWKLLLLLGTMGNFTSCIRTSLNTYCLWNNWKAHIYEIKIRTTWQMLFHFTG